jgi:phage baseplate assembly protein gpV
MTTLLEVIQGVARHQTDQVLTCEIGKVSEVFPHTGEDDKNNYECNVEIPGLGGELRKVPIATQHIGTACMPNVGDLVVVAFVRGNVNQPIVIGRLYNDEDHPPLFDQDQVIHRLPLGAEDDAALIVELRKENDDSQREVLIKLPSKLEIQLVDTKALVQVGDTKLTLEQEGDDDGIATIESGASKITINQDGDILVESEGELSLKSTGDMSLEAPNISIKSDEAIEIESGTETSLTAGSSATIEASSTMDIKGSTVNIN